MNINDTNLYKVTQSVPNEFINSKKEIKEDAKYTLYEVSFRGGDLEKVDDSSFISVEHCLSHIPNLNLSNSWAPDGYFLEAIYWWVACNRKKYEKAKELIDLFLDKGADPLVVNKNGLNALDVLSEEITKRKTTENTREIAIKHLIELESLFKHVRKFSADTISILLPLPSVLH